MHEPEWVTLLEVFDRLEAEIIKEALEAQGLQVALFQEGASHFIYPVGGPLGRIQICVPDGRLEQAQKWLEDFQQGTLEEQNSSEVDGSGQNDADRENDQEGDSTSS